MIYFLEVVWNIPVEGKKKCSGHFSVVSYYLWNKTRNWLIVGWSKFS